jgi:hypothetical protein
MSHYNIENDKTGFKNVCERKCDVRRKSHTEFGFSEGNGLPWLTFKQSTHVLLCDRHV